MVREGEVHRSDKEKWERDWLGEGSETEEKVSV